jgi:hypothetical protein
MSDGRLNHLELLVEKSSNVEHIKSRLIEAGLATFDERDATCCYSQQDKIWVHDPDGNQWEIYALISELDDEEIDIDQQVASLHAERPGTACCNAE